MRAQVMTGRVLRPQLKPASAATARTGVLNLLSKCRYSTFRIAHSPHYAKWMGGAVHNYPAEIDAGKFWFRMFLLCAASTVMSVYWEMRIQKYVGILSTTRPEWYSSFTSDLEFNPPLWMAEIPGSMTYIRTVELEDTWERVSQIRGKHWTDDYEYTKPWEVDDGQYSGRAPGHHSFM